jgi:hypothetical protein
MTDLIPHRLPNGNVLPFASRAQRAGLGTAGRATQSDPWKRLTRMLILDRAARGELEPALVEYLLDAAGVA